jgi:hypothetical protein
MLNAQNFWTHSEKRTCGGELQVNNDDGMTTGETREKSEKADYKNLQTLFAAMHNWN